MLKMPEVMDANLINFEALGQMRANRFDKLTDAFAKPAEMLRQLSLHVFARRCDQENAVAFPQLGLPICINEAFVGGSYPFKAANKVSRL